jgi:outer membrane protein assembly factor BamA
MGYSLNRADEPSHFELSLSLPHGQKLEYGAYFQRSSAKVKDLVPFPATGQVETRNYELTAMGGGAKILFRINETYSAYVNIGLTRTTSELKDVSTTAPLPPSLSLGPQDGAVWALSHGVGAIYERFYRYGSFGATLSYGSTSSNPDAEIQDLALGAFVKFYRKQQDP